jgi:cysteine-rich repeat protein
VRNAVQAVLTRPGRSPRALEIPTGTVTLRRGASGPDRPDGWLEAASELFVVTASASRPRLPRARGVDEVEPNDTPALAHELSAPPSSFEGTLAPGDVDVLALDGLAPRRLRLTARCATADLALVARGADAEGAPLGAVARVAPLPCGRPVEAALAALPGDLLLRVEGSPRVEQSYRLELDAVVPRCGDGVVDRDEACDDGNPVSGDGCDRRCQIEGLDELEPNAVRPNASRLRPGVQSGFLVLSDTDWYRLVVAPGSGGPWRFAIEDARGGCDLDARLALVDARGRRLGEAGEDGLGCPRLDAPVSVLGPGTWYLRVAAGRGRHLSPRGLYRLIATPPP